ncbi:MAG TPA: SIS domain-containing protein [Blastocatellia bacterium]|nr:SIS domain-containing protein [Blastocatellia bacterium]
MHADGDNSPATLSEIYDQARSCAETIRRADERNQIFNSFLPLDQYSDILITGCGSSHHLAMCASFAWSEMLARPVVAVAASELMHFADHYLSNNSRPLVIAISRSGGTSEVRLAVELLKRDYNARALAITGEAGGTVANVCDAELAFDECYERSVVMTQAFTCILTGLYLLADGASGNRRAEEIKRIPDLIANALRSSEEVFRAMAETERIERFFFLGSGAMKGLTDECALKMIEMALDTALSYRALEFRHGPKATLNENDLAIIFPAAAEQQHLETLLAEIEATGARALVVERAGNAETRDRGKLSTSQSSSIHRASASPRQQFFAIAGELSETFRPALYAHAGQLLAYWRAVARRLNPDAPPHLARTVLLDA